MHVGVNVTDLEINSILQKGLFFVGLSGQRSLSSATIRGVGRDANYVVKKLNLFLLQQTG